MLTLPIPTIATFAALTMAHAALWWPRERQPWRFVPLWALPAAAAVAAALAGGLMDVRGLAGVFAFAAACLAAARAGAPVARFAAHAVMLAICAGLFLHVMPGFDNPLVISNVVLGPGSLPYTKFLNLDKGIAGLFLLGLYAPQLPAGDQGLRHGAAFVWRFAVLVTVVMVASVAAGYVTWDPKLPFWWPAWMWSMVFLTALPEEALFRGVIQTSIATSMGGTPTATAAAIGIAGTLFGLAHVGGGPIYVVLASLAGIGYGWIYASTRSIAAGIAAHAGLNTLHFLLFTYPSLAAPLAV